MAAPKKDAAKKTAAKKTTKPRKRASTKRKPAAPRASKATQEENEAKVAAQPTPPVPEDYFIRNLAGAPFSVRLERQQETRRRTELKPRGQRGDLAKLKEEDLNDPAIVENVNIGLIEIITAAEAASVAHKQTENQQQVHPALSVITNELGEPYKPSDIKTDELPFEQQGVVVAELDGGEVQVGRGGIQREIPRREGIISDGFAAQQGQTSEQVRDQIARDAKKRGVQGPEAGLGGLEVKVSPTQPSPAG